MKMIVQVKVLLHMFCILLAIRRGEAIVGGSTAAPPEPDEAVVFAQYHGRSARVQGIKSDAHGYYSFLGIRYAEPPLGQRRFQRPVRYYLEGDVLAQKPWPPCVQKDPYNPNKAIGQEDCLCLNVYAPKMPGDEKGSPVIFFIHGGNHRSGSATRYGGQHLAQRDTILVSVQYRLGSLGFISSGGRDAAGNAGLFDLESALNWVYDYIEFFGGDKTRVSIMGHGSGGSAASLLALSPIEERSRSPIRGVAALSGSPLTPGAVKNNSEQMSHKLAHETGCPTSPTESMILCLNKLPAQKIVLADDKLVGDMIDVQGFLDDISGKSGVGVRVEDEYDNRGLPPLITQRPSDSLKKNKHKCHLLTGVTSAETKRAVFGKYNGYLNAQLKKVNDFIEKEVVNKLQDILFDVQNLIPLETKPSTTLKNYYQSFIEKSSNEIEGLSKIAEATGDALFNMPAYLSVNEWSSSAPAFLYSFQHEGNLPKGSHFLPGLALTGAGYNSENTDVVQGPAHGDELAYIFEPLDDEAQTVNHQISSTDQNIRNNFVDLIANFAHRTSERHQPNTSSIFSSIGPGQFLKIDDGVTVDKDFRFCQMALWTNAVNKMSSSVCKNIFSKLLQISKLPVVNPSKLPIIANINNIPIVGKNPKPKTPFLNNLGL